MSKISREVENRILVSGKVVASARAHGPKVALILADRAASDQGVQTSAALKAYTTVLSTLADALELASENLRKAERAHTAEQADDEPVRQQREEALQSLLATAIRTRSVVEDHFGAIALKTYGLQGETPRAPRTLFQHAANVANLMTKTPAVVTSELGFTVDTTVMASVLRSKAALLEGALSDLDREERELEESLAARNRALSAWTESYQGVANTLVGLYRLAGWNELAERVRPTRRTTSGEEPGPELPVDEEEAKAA